MREAAPPPSNHDPRACRRRALALAVSAALCGAALETQAQGFPGRIQLSALDGSNGFAINGVQASQRSGSSVSSAGDINGDGIDDLIIGAPRANPDGTFSGSSYVVFGKASGFDPTLQLSALNGTNGFRLDGVAASDVAGISVSDAGDINGDGIDDLVVGAYGADPNGTYSGSSYVVFGKTSGFNPTLQLSALNGSNGFRLDGVAAGDQAGRALRAAGDINGDGIADLIVGAYGADPNGSFSGSSYVLFGQGAGFPANLALDSLNGSNGFRLDGAAAFDFSGRAVSGAGDVNGDGIDDLVISAFAADPNGVVGAGSSYVVFGRDPTVQTFPAALQLSGLDGSNGFRIDGEQGNDGAGSAVSAAGDFNGDGIDDLLIGAPGVELLNGLGTGRGYVVYGTRADFPATLRLDSLDGNNGVILDGAVAGGQAGSSVSRAGDVNGDGVDDLLIGAPATILNGSSTGSTHVVFGVRGGLISPQPLSDLVGPNGFSLDGEAAFDYAGRSVSAAGDVNGDGVDDLIVGAPGNNVNGFDSGRSYVVFGRVTGTPVVDFGGMKLIDFGEVFVGVASPAQTITLSNPGDGMVQIDTITIPDLAFALAGGSCGALPIRIRVDESCTIELVFTPQAEGASLSELTFTGSSVTSPDSVILFGTGLPAPVVSLLPDPLEFGDVALGAQATQMLIVENTGAGTLEPGAVFITGPQASEFSIELNTCAGAQLSTGQFCGIDIGFAPTAPGIRQATLRLDSNAPSNPDFVPLRGSNDLLFSDGLESP